MIYANTVTGELPSRKKYKHQINLFSQPREKVRFRILEKKKIDDRPHR